MENGSLIQKIRQYFKVEEEMDEEMLKETYKLVRNIFRYMDKDAKDIMTHRKKIIAVDGEETLEDVLKFMLNENYTRFPVYQDDIDGIIGFLHLRDIMKGYLYEESHQVPIGELKQYIRPVSFVPETKSIDTLFREMQKTKNHVAIVLDEYGQTSGLVTMEDILEEIVGNILDEHDEENKTIVHVAKDTYMMFGLVELEEVEDLLPIRFDKNEYETLNGFLINELEHIPSENEHAIIEYEGYRFTVMEVEDNIIQRVKIEKMNEE